MGEITYQVTRYRGAEVRLSTRDSLYSNLKLRCAGALEQMFRWLHEIAEEKEIEVHWASAYQMFTAVEALTGPLNLRSRVSDAVDSVAGVR